VGRRVPEDRTVASKYADGQNFVDHA
jgi:hypothetical protein